MSLLAIELGDFDPHGFEVTATRNRGGDVLLHATYRCTCVDTGRQDAEVNTREVVDGETWADMSTEEQGEKVRALVLRALEHEVDEWLRIDGEWVVPPHRWNREAADAG